MLTLFPDSDSPIASHFCLICGSRGGVDAVLNIILFVPLGIGLGLLGARARLALSAMCVLSALIETTQFFFIAGRDATIGDVVMNTLGGALGLVIGRHAFTLLRPSSRIALLLSVGGSIVWLAIQTVSASGFSPAIPSSEYYGEIARQLGHFEQFRGRVLHASIADVPVPDTRFADSRKVRELLDHGATVTTTVLPAGRTHDIAPIVRVADARQREIVLLAQDGDKLIFGVRTRAVVLGFRPPIFALSDLFPAVARRDIGLTTDTIAMRASYSTREARLNAQTARVTRDRRQGLPRLDHGPTISVAHRGNQRGATRERNLDCLDADTDRLLGRGWNPAFPGSGHCKNPSDSGVDRGGASLRWVGRCAAGVWTEPGAAQRLAGRGDRDSFGRRHSHACG